MNQIPYRTLLRNAKAIFPIPEAGIEIVRQKGNFFIYPRSMIISVSSKPDILSDKPTQLRKLEKVIEDAGVKPYKFSGKTKRCPFCNADVAVELANKHFLENHE